MIKIISFRTLNPTGPNGNGNGQANRITFDEFATLTRRMDRMEYSVGNIVSRVLFLNFS